LSASAVSAPANELTATPASTSDSIEESRPASA
jgi:hypothetical protein